MRNNALRYSFNIFPPDSKYFNKIGHTLGLVLNPMEQLQCKPLDYRPVVCQICRSVLNPFCKVDFSNKTYQCSICYHNNILPAAYHNMTEENVSAELRIENSSVDYESPENPDPRLVIIFVVDIAVYEKDIESLKNVLYTALSNVPENSFIGFITYGKVVYVHRVRFSEVHRSFVFNGAKEYTSEQLYRLLGISGQNIADTNDFVVPAKDAEVTINNIIDSLEMDSFQTPKDERRARCTGSALSIAMTLMQVLYPKVGGHIILFNSGIPTRGPGSVASILTKDPIRQVNTMNRMSSEAETFYYNLSKNASDHNIVVDYFHAGFDDGGFHEMEKLVSSTGGFAISGESWNDDEINKSLSYYLSTVIQSAFKDCVVTLSLPSCLLVNGMISDGISLHGSTPIYSKNVIGKGNTNSWKVNNMYGQNLAFYLEVKDTPVAVHTTCLQFLIRYKNLVEGKYYLRVITSPIQFGTNDHEWLLSIDFTVHSLLLARLATSKPKQLDFLDQEIVRVCRTLRHTGIELIYRLFYHLRFCDLFNYLNVTPDYLKHKINLFNTLDSSNSYQFMMPTLIKLTLQNGIEYVDLSDAHMTDDCILVLDVFTVVVFWYGKTVVSWKEQKYDEMEDHSNFKEMLEKVENLKQASSNRFPYPTIIVCEQNSSAERFLLKMVTNPPVSNVSRKPSYCLDTNTQAYDDFVKKINSLI